MNSEPLDKSKKATITPTLVTGFSANHFHEHTTHIENLKEKFPGQKVVVYDLGLEPDQIEFIKERPEFYVYRYFDFEQYPEHVKILKNYAWKTMIWAQVLPEFGSILWFDTSIYFWKNAEDAIKTRILGRDTCWVFYIKQAGHDIASHTHPRMWTYSQCLKTNLLKKVLNYHF